VSNRLKLVSSSDGYALVFDHDGNGFVTAARGFNTGVSYVSTATTCAGAALKTGYSYSSAKLSGFSDVSGNFAAIGTSFTAPCLISNALGSCEVAFYYDSMGMTQKLADGTVWHFSSTGDLDFINGPTSYESSTITDPAGRMTHYSPMTNFSTGATYYEVVDQLNRTTHVDTSRGFDVNIVLPEGNRVIPGYNSRGVLLGNTFVPKAGSGSPTIAQGLPMNMARLERRTICCRVAG